MLYEHNSIHNHETLTIKLNCNRALLNTNLVEDILSFFDYHTFLLVYRSLIEQNTAPITGKE